MPNICTPLQGLSHYLEHMLFMGSEKFPDENDYDAYLASSGGASNAYTELVRTIPSPNDLAH
jgi:nardilysin